MKVCTRCRKAKPDQAFPQGSRKCLECSVEVKFKETRTARKILKDEQKKAKDDQKKAAKDLVDAAELAKKRE